MKLDRSTPGLVLIKPNHDFGDSSPFRLAPSPSSVNKDSLVWIEWSQSGYTRKTSRQGPVKRKTPLLEHPRLFFFEDGAKRSIGVAWPKGLNPTDRFHYQLNKLIHVWHKKAAKRGVDHPKPYANVRYTDFFAEILSF